MLACAQDQPTETKEKKADAANTQDAKICVDYESCKKTVGCSRMCPKGQKHRGMCVVGGKALKPDKMQTEDDEPKAGADHVLGADRVLRERKHPMEKFLEDAESSLNTPQPKAKKHKSTDASAKKQLASVKKELASVKKELALIKKENA